MFRSFMRKIHRWIFIAMGFFMLVWVVSGIVISVPGHWLERKAEGQQHAMDLAAYALSPAEIVSRLESSLEAGASVKSLGLQKIGDRALYSVRVKNGDDLLIDAGSGELFSMTPEMAEDIVRKGFGIDSAVRENSTLRKHVISYAWGPLPVYRLQFEGDPSRIYYVNPMSGKIHESSWLTRARMAAGFLHSFKPVEMLTGRESVQVWTLLITGIVSLIGVLAGVYLVFPIRKRKAVSS